VEAVLLSPSFQINLTVERCGYGLSHWNDHTGFTESWRTSVAIQFLPALIFLLGLPFCGETPRWLVEQGRITDAQKSLQYLRGHDADPAAVAAELASIQQNVELHHNIEKSTWTVLFTDRDLFARLWRAALLQFMAQMCGATAIKYYLPTNFLALGLGKELSLLASGIESSLKVGCTIMEMLIIDKVGRRRTLLLGSVVMSVACLVRCPLFHLKS
jgi:MFS family permease